MSGLMFSGSDFLAIPCRAPRRARRARVLGSKVSVAVSLQEPHPRGTGWPGMARDGPEWQMLRGCDAPRPLVPGRLYDIFPRTEIFFTKKIQKAYEHKTISASPSVVLKPNSCCGTNNFLTKKKTYESGKPCSKLILEPPKSDTGLNVKSKWPSRFLFGEAFRFSIFSMPPGYAARTCCPGANSAGRPQPYPSFCRCIPPRGAPFTGPAEVG